MAKRECAFCSTEIDKGVKTCPRCGSNDIEHVQEERLERSDPYPYNGYIVYAIFDFMRIRDAIEYHFYLGERLVEIIKVSRDVLKKLVPENTDEMDFIWDLFLIAQGKEEVLRVVEQNTVTPATFEIRRVKSEKEQWLSGLTKQAYLDAYIEGEIGHERV